MKAASEGRPLESTQKHKPQVKAAFEGQPQEITQKNRPQLKAALEGRPLKAAFEGRPLESISRRVRLLFLMIEFFVKTSVVLFFYVVYLQIFSSFICFMIHVVKKKDSPIFSKRLETAGQPLVSSL